MPLFVLVLVLLSGVAGCRGRTGNAGPADRATGAGRPNVVLVTIDTFRADRFTPRLTPALDALGRRGVVFTNARSCVPLTLPAHVSLMTGALPPAHGVRENGVHRFDGRLPTIAQVLARHGYDTAAFIGAYVLDRRFGLDAGFATYDDRIPRDPAATDRLQAERRADQVVDAALAWLRSRGAGARPRAAGAESRAPSDERRAPFFLWVHLYDPHAPYTPPPEYRQKAGGHAYDGEVAFADAQVARLLAALDTAGHRDRTAVIVAGDHGESLGEHGEETHGMLLYDGALRVPLVVAAPRVAPAVHHDAVSLVDVAPAILGLTGAPVPGSMKGTSVLGVPTPSRDVYAETEYPRVVGWSPLASLVDGRWKVIQSPDTELYDLQQDARETTNVAASRTSMVRAMFGRLTTLRATTAAPAAVAPGADVAERLRALGYVAPPPAPAMTGIPGANPAREIAAWVRFETALTLMNEHEPARALPALSALARAHPEAQVFASTYAQALGATGQQRAALPVWRRLVARWPRDASLYHELAVTARDAGARDEAMRAERAALAIDPVLPSAHNGLGLLLVDGSRAVEAVKAFGEAVRLDVTNGGYWTNLGNARRETGDVSGAETAYRAALEHDPTSADALNGLGALLVQAGRAAEAVPLFEQLLAHDPSFIEARLNLGIALQDAGQRARAAEQFRAVLKAPPRHARERRAAQALLEGLGQ